MASVRCLVGSLSTFSYMVVSERWSRPSLTYCSVFSAKGSTSTRPKLTPSTLSLVLGGTFYRQEVDPQVAETLGYTQQHVQKKP